MKKLRTFIMYAVTLLVRPKEAAAAVNAAETPEQLDEYISDIYNGRTPGFKSK